MNNKLKHTPGPWEVQEKCAYGYDIRSDYDSGFIWVSVAEGPHDSSNGWPNESQSKANARLIAAAPEMIEALIYSYRLIKSTGLSIPQISEIIERATGLSIEEVLAE